MKKWIMLIILIIGIPLAYSITFKTIYNPFTAKFDYYSVHSDLDNFSIGDLNISKNLKVTGTINTTQLNSQFVNTTYLNVTGTDRNATFQGDVRIIGKLYGGSPLQIEGGINLTSGKLTYGIYDYEYITQENRSWVIGVVDNDTILRIINISNIRESIWISSNDTIAWHIRYSETGFDFAKNFSFNRTLINENNLSWVTSNERNPSNASIELALIGGYSALWNYANNQSGRESAYYQLTNLSTALITLNLTANFSNVSVVKLNLGWTNLTNYPVACPSGTFVTQIEDSITCTSVDTSSYWNFANNMTWNNTLINFGNRSWVLEMLGNSTINRSINLNNYNRSISLVNYNQSVSLVDYLTILSSFFDTFWNYANNQSGRESAYFRIINISNTLYPSFNATKINATNITAINITARRFTGSLDCGMLTGGSDADFCADATGAGGGGITNNSPAILSLLIVTGRTIVQGNLNATTLNGTLDCATNLRFTDGSIGSSAICDGADATGGGGASVTSRQLVIWKSPSSSIANQGLNLPAALTLLDLNNNGSCYNIDFDNDIGSELKCEVMQRIAVAAAGLVINVSIRDLNNISGNSNLCERRMQGAVVGSALNMTNGTRVWFNKPSWFNGNKTICVFTAGGNAAADFGFSYINLWTR